MWCRRERVEVPDDDANLRYDENWGWMHRNGSAGAWHTVNGHQPRARRIPNPPAARRR
jgi:hypothetical protein